MDLFEFLASTKNKNKNVKDIKLIKKKLYGGKLNDETPPSKNKIKKFSFSDFVKSLTY